ncbi:MAG: tripartite tricarboxylate transporter TctB family protein [Planctomycetota bacterium]|jgi:hypothetical protein|nr:tripartite tricarboxylate transporter TctB family protein [Planctomycetota bacterium]
MTAAERRIAIRDMAGAAGFAAAGLVFLGEMGDLPEQAAKYPLVLIYLMFALCAALFAKAIALLASGRHSRPSAAAGTGDPETEGRGKSGLPTVFVPVLSFLYVFSMPYIGFTLASAAMMIAFMLAAGVRSVPVLVLTPLCEIAFLRYVFEELLAVFLPGADFLTILLGMG